MKTEIKTHTGRAALQRQKANQALQTLVQLLSNGQTISLMPIKNTEAAIFEGTQISTLKNLGGPKTAAAIIIKLLQELSMYFANDWSADHFKMYTETILQNYWYLKIEELILVFRNATSGRYGKLFGKLTYANLTEWIATYEEQKISIIESHRTQHRASRSGDGSTQLQTIKKLLPNANR